MFHDHRLDHREFRPSHALQLWCEGRVGCQFIEAMLADLELGEQFEVINSEGIHDLGARLGVLIRAPEFRRVVRRLVIIRDAEDDPAGARQSVYDALARAGLPERVETGVYLFPDNESSGCLEHLVRRSIGDHQQAAECTDAFFGCIGLDPVRANPNHAVKSWLQVWLASQGTRAPAQHCARAAQQGLINLSHPAFDALRNFLRDAAK